jgi:hypothetical protein
MKHLRRMNEIIDMLANADPSNLDLKVLVVCSRRTLGFVTMEKFFRHNEAQD